MIRLMGEKDISLIRDLEQLCFSDPWSEQLLVQGLGSSLDTWYVLEEEGRIFGYCNLRIIADEGEVERIAVHPQCRGLGYGKQLMERMVLFAKEQGVKEMTLEVRAGNDSAIKLYEAYGFVKEAVRKAYYREPLEDGIIMWNHRL